MPDMLTIIEMEAREDGGHGLQAQSGRESCWLEGWVAVPPELVGEVNACAGYCELDLDESGVLVGIRPTERPPEPEPEPTTEEFILEFMAEQEARICMLELEVV